MGFGIVEPIDDFDLTRYYPDQPLPKGWTVQPSNPYLLDTLAKDFQKSNFSFKHLVRTIMKSSAYQLSSRFESEWKPEYTHVLRTQVCSHVESHPVAGCDLHRDCASG